MREITPKDIDAALGHSEWDLANRVLYDLCKSHYKHKIIEETIAKVLLIGRSYAASIERRRNKTVDNDDFYIRTVAPCLRESSIDDRLAELSPAAPPGSPDTIFVHKWLMERFESITKLNKRSLASKYLHFHLPGSFFIYDGRAVKAVQKVVPPLGTIRDIRANSYDPEYKNFVRRCTWLHEHIREHHGKALSRGRSTICYWR